MIEKDSVSAHCCFSGCACVLCRALSAKLWYKASSIELNKPLNIKRLQIKLNINDCTNLPTNSARISKLNVSGRQWVKSQGLSNTILLRISVPTQTSNVWIISVNVWYIMDKMICDEQQFTSLIRIVDHVHLQRQRYPSNPRLTQSGSVLNRQKLYNQ